MLRPRNKPVPTAASLRATIEELLEKVFLRGLRLEVVILWRKGVGVWYEMAASLSVIQFVQEFRDVQY
jgi:hypothetical protein